MDVPGRFSLTRTAIGVELLLFLRCQQRNNKQNNKMNIVKRNLIKKIDKSFGFEYLEAYFEQVFLFCRAERRKFSDERHSGSVVGMLQQRHRQSHRYRCRYCDRKLFKNCLFRYEVIDILEQNNNFIDCIRLCEFRL